MRIMVLYFGSCVTEITYEVFFAKVKVIFARGFDFFRGPKNGGVMADFATPCGRI